MDIGIGMITYLFAAVILPLILLLVAVRNKSIITFLLGGVSFLLLQVIVPPLWSNIASLNSNALLYLIEHNLILYATISVLFSVLFEETVRFLIIKYVMRAKTVLFAVMLGLGYGSVQVFYLLGMPLIKALSTSAQLIDEDMVMVLGAFERVCVLIVHACLAVLILYGVKYNRWQLYIVAVLAGVLTRIIPYAVGLSSHMLLTALAILTVTTAMVLYTLKLHKKIAA